jgi:hypothetical protein
MNTVFNIPIDFRQIFNALKQLPYNERKKLAKILEKKEIDNTAMDFITESENKIMCRTFNAVKLDLSNFKFNRDEANQR